MNIKYLAEEFEKTLGPVIHRAEKPTDESVDRIEKELGLKLPSSLIEFATLSKNYGNWLASLGPDYESYCHIITLNKVLTEDGQIPNNFIAINVGYDEDYDCIDAQTYDERTDEYLITYWAYDVSLRESALYGGFPDYIEDHIKFWAKNS